MTINRTRPSSNRSESLTTAAGGKTFTADGWQLKAILAGIKDLDSGRSIDHQHVRQWMQSWGTGRERRAPR